MMVHAYHASYTAGISTRDEVQVVLGKKYKPSLKK
jgi:hypothetical protein